MSVKESFLRGEDCYNRKQYKEAFSHFHSGAIAGHAESQHNIGMLYFQGKGVLQDYVLAYAWLNLAAASGFEPAMEGREYIKTEMTKEQIADAQCRSRNL